MGVSLAVPLELLGVAFAVERGRSVLGCFSGLTEPLSEQDSLRLGRS